MRSQLGAFPRKMYSLKKKHLSIHNFYVVQWHWCCLRNLINFWRTLYMYSKHIPTDLLNIFFSYYLHHFRTNWAALPVIHNIATVLFFLSYLYLLHLNGFCNLLALSQYVVMSVMQLTGIIVTLLCYIFIQSRQVYLLLSLASFKVIFFNCYANSLSIPWNF